MKSLVLSHPKGLSCVAALCLSSSAGPLQALPGEVISSPELPPFEVQGDIAAAALQQDGRIIIAGSFRSVDGVPVAGLARVNPDGSLDRTFTPGIGIQYYPRTYSTWSNADITRSLPEITLLPLPDGRLWLEFRNSDKMLWGVLGPDGTRLPGAFPSLPVSGGATSVHAVGVAEGVLVASESRRNSKFQGNTIVREIRGGIRGLALNDDRTLWHYTRETGPQPERAWPAGKNGWWVVGDDPDPDPQILSQGLDGTIKELWRITLDGKLDLSVPPIKFNQRLVQDFQPFSDGSMAVFSTFYTTLTTDGGNYYWSPYESVQAQVFSPDGKKEARFWDAQWWRGALMSEAMPDGTILTTLGAGTSIRRIARDGRVVAPFSQPPIPRPGYKTLLLALPEGRFQLNGDRFHSDGSPDTSWHLKTSAPGSPQDVIRDSNGALWARGSIAQPDGTLPVKMHRLRPDGSLDFTSQLDPEIVPGVVSSVSGPRGTVYLLQERIAPAGFSRTRLLRILPDGKIDPVFRICEGQIPATWGDGTVFGGQVGPIAVFPDGSLIVTLGDGRDSVPYSWRKLTAAGGWDPGFKPVMGKNFDGPPFLLGIPDGRFWVGAQRYLPDGTKDISLPFTPSRETPPCLLEDGTILVKETSSTLRAVLPNGREDPTFISPMPPGQISLLESAPGGGFFLRSSSIPSFLGRTWMVRCRRNGSIDPSFRCETVSAIKVPGEVILTPDGSMKGGGKVMVSSAKIVNISGNRTSLWGSFTHVGERRQQGLAILDATVPRTWQDWSAATFRLQPPPAGGEAPGADPDGDGANNFLEYAMGTDPLGPESGGPGLLLESTTPLRFFLPRNPDATGLRAVLEFSGDLQSWLPVTVADYTETSDAGKWRFEVKADIGGNSHFRIRFSQN